MPIHILSEIFALLTGIVLYKRLSVPFKILTWFLLFVIMVECTGYYITAVLHKPNHSLFNVTVPLSFGVYLLVFHNLLKGRAWQPILFVISTVFFAFAIGNLFYIQGIPFFNTYTMMLGSVIVICLSGALLFQLISSGDEVIILWKIPEFWLVVSLLTSFTGTLLYWTLFNLGYDTSGYYFRWMIKSQVYVRYLLMAISFLCFYKFKQQIISVT
ncbi:MAG: hypothetical protein V4717_15980 [Bacteroidota bacterium]